MLNWPQEGRNMTVLGGPIGMVMCIKAMGLAAKSMPNRLKADHEVVSSTLPAYEELYKRRLKF